MQFLFCQEVGAADFDFRVLLLCDIGLNNNLFLLFKLGLFFHHALTHVEFFYLTFFIDFFPVTFWGIRIDRSWPNIDCLCLCFIRADPLTMMLMRFVHFKVVLPNQMALFLLKAAYFWWKRPLFLEFEFFRGIRIILGTSNNYMIILPISILLTSLSWVGYNCICISCCKVLLCQVILV